LVAEKKVTANGVYGFFPANSDGDDVVIYTDDSRTQERLRLPMLRQQWEREGQTAFRCLADYLAPAGSGLNDYIGAFAVTAGLGVDDLVARYEAAQDIYNSIMVKSLADRLAESFAELAHERARGVWGFGREERLSKEDLIAEKYRGIRPAMGYPSCPDISEMA